jgi:hypothetical protein
VAASVQAEQEETLLDGVHAIRVSLVRRGQYLEGFGPLEFKEKINKLVTQKFLRKTTRM